MEDDENIENSSEAQPERAETELFADSALPEEKINLKDELEGGEEALLPPEEENEAKEMNLGAVFATIFIGIAVIVMIATFSGGKKKKKAQKELDKAGSKYEVEFKDKEPERAVEKFDKELPSEDTDKDEDLDAIINNTPGLEVTQPPPGKAPVAPVGSGSYSKSERPDTRNSKSPRKIEGLKGQPSPDTNQNIVNAVMNGSYSPNGQGQRQQMPSKEEYISQMLGRMNGGENSAAIFQQNRENFYNNGQGTGGTGNFMPFNSLWDGTVISGALVTAINTDNPGVVIARVTENVYSSYDQSLLLIPEGSTLYATYNSSISYGQNKVQVAWNLLIRPDGYRIVLGNMNGVNAQGESGYKGSVNNHPWETLKALGLIAIYSLIQTEITQDIAKSNNQYMQNMMSDVYAQASKIGNKMIDRALDIKPTIKIKAGTEIKLITNTPLELPPVQINPATRKYIRTR